MEFLWIANATAKKHLARPIVVWLHNAQSIAGKRERGPINVSQAMEKKKISHNQPDWLVRI